MHTPPSPPPCAHTHTPAHHQWDIEDFAEGGAALEAEGYGSDAETEEEGGEGEGSDEEEEEEDEEGSEDSAEESYIESEASDEDRWVGSLQPPQPPRSMAATHFYSPDFPLLALPLQRFTSRIPSLKDAAVSG